MQNLRVRPSGYLSPHSFEKKSASSHWVDVVVVCTVAAADVLLQECEKFENIQENLMLDIDKTLTGAQAESVLCQGYYTITDGD